MLYFYLPPGYTKYQYDVALFHVTLYKYTVSLCWKRALLKPRASFGSFA